MADERAGLERSDSFYKQNGIEKDGAKPCEDGMRTNGLSGSFEWWYADAEFDNGMKVVPIFYSKKHFDVDGPAQPLADIEIDYPDGTQRLVSSFGSKGTVLDAKRDACDVRVNKSTFRYVDGKYLIHYEEEDIVYDAVMEPTLPMWRPESGITTFGEDRRFEFGWFVAAPSANVEATLTEKGKTIKLKGTGYHDHNWGNASMDKMMNHWYWCRASVDGYTVICSDIVAAKQFGYTRLPMFLLAKDGKIISDDQDNVLIDRADSIVHPVTGKFMDNHLTFTQKISADESYSIEFIRHGDIFCRSLLELASPVQRFVGKLLCMNPTYTRCVGDVRITHVKGQDEEVSASEGLWEQMSLSSNETATINDSRHVVARS